MVLRDYPDGGAAPSTLRSEIWAFIVFVLALLQSSYHTAAFSTLKLKGPEGQVRPWPLWVVRPDRKNRRRVEIGDCPGILRICSTA
jgi:hypothetical protein